jgi:tetratricopeptide (TPR) repeat protein
VLTDPARLRIDRRALQRDLHVHAALRSAAARRFDDAVREYGAALALDPKNADVRDGMARMLARAGQDSLARGFFRNLLREHPDDGRTWYNFGNFCRRRGRHAEALAAFAKSVELDPTREAAWNHLGETQRALGDTAAAAAAYRRAIAVVPAYDRALNNLAALNAQQGHGRAAEKGFRAALEANPRYLPALVNLGILLTEAGRHPEAVAVWRRALAVDPRNEVVRRALGQLDPTRALPDRGVTALPTGDED